MKKNGFTLVELMVVIGIIALLTTILIPQFQGFNRNKTLQDASTGLQSALRVAQNNAQSGLKCNSTTAAKSWSLKVTSASTYTVTAVCNPSGTPETKTYTLPADVTFSAISTDKCSSLDPTSDTPEVIFSNISGYVSFSSVNACAALSNNMKFDLNSSLRVMIDKGGSVSITPL